MTPLLFCAVVLVLGVVAGRLGGWRGWLLVPALVVLSVVLAVLVDPFVAVAGALAAVVAVPGVGIGLLLRRRALRPDGGPVPDPVT